MTNTVVAVYPDGFNTSAEANESIAPKKAAIRDIVLSAIRTFGTEGAIGEQVADLTGLRVDTVSPRFAELAKRGMIVYQTTPRRNSKGRSQRVMVAADLFVEQPAQAQGYADSAN